MNFTKESIDDIINDDNTPEILLNCAKDIKILSILWDRKIWESWLKCDGLSTEGTIEDFQMRRYKFVLNEYNDYWFYNCKNKQKNPNNQYITPIQRQYERYKISKMKVNNLRTVLQSKGAPLSGKKKELVERLSEITEKEIDEHNEAIPEYGKWMLFYPKNEMEIMWEKIQRLYEKDELYGVHSMKCSSGRKKNPRASNDEDGVIILYTTIDTEENIKRIGTNILNKTKYSLNERIFYKTDKQTHSGTKATGNIKNSTFSIYNPYYNSKVQCLIEED